MSFSSVSIFDFEQINFSWEYALTSIVKLKILSWEKNNFLTGYNWFRFGKKNSLLTLEISLQNTQNFLAANNNLSK